jgi:hypothetical protein
MLAMHYRFALPDDDALLAVRRRIAERGPFFDGMEGLAHKFFLVDPVEPTYATFYLWQNEQAALRFLRGPFFTALVETFGRPEVHLLLPQTIALPPFEMQTAWLSDAATETPSERVGTARIDALDPVSGRSFSLDFTPDAAGRRYEIAYHAWGTAALGRSRMSDAVSVTIL